MAMNFILNGHPRVENIRPTMTVLDWLRGGARLTGTKEGCAEGDCGACTILVCRPDDGVEAPRWRAVNACLMVMGQIDGCAVTTVEGVAAPDRLGAAQQAMLDTDATQCGFCTPGFVMAMTDLQQNLQQDGPADETIIHEALAGNLCRCTGYRAIIDACRAMPAAPPALPVGLPARGTRHESDGAAFMTPTRLGEFLALRARHPDAVLLAGGTDLGLRISKGGERWPLTISMAAVTELTTIVDDGDAITVGGAVTYSDALPALDRRIPAFAALVRRIGSRQIRNLGTLAGNLATASPIGDTLPCLIALAARVRLASARGSRVMAVEDFITGYRTTALADDEIIQHIVIPVPAPGARFAAYKLSKRFDQDISVVVTAFHAAADDGRMLRAAFGGMASRVERATAVEAAWAAGAIEALSVDELEALVARDFSPLSDHRGSAAYRRRAAAGLVRRFILEGSSDAAPATLEAL
jgi:xanthine dehydrogenase small subunit